MKNSILAEVILGGAVVVAVGVGNQVGGGDGKSLATAAGVVAGGCTGSKVQKRVQVGSTEAVYHSEKLPAGYQVTYLLDGKQSVVRMDHEPGKRIRVEDGNSVLPISQELRLRLA